MEDGRQSWKLTATRYHAESIFYRLRAIIDHLRHIFPQVLTDLLTTRRLPLSVHVSGWHLFDLVDRYYMSNGLGGRNRLLSKAPLDPIETLISKVADYLMYWKNSSVENWLEKTTTTPNYATWNTNELFSVHALANAMSRFRLEFGVNKHL